VPVRPVPQHAWGAFTVGVANLDETGTFGVTLKFGDMVVGEQGETQVRQHKNLLSCSETQPGKVAGLRGLGL